MENKIKVMHFVSGLVSGGVEQMLCNYCRFMDHNRYEFVVVYQHEPVIDCLEKIEAAGCKTVRITARCENFLVNLIQAYKVIKKYNPDIVHAHMNLMNFCALFPALLAGVKIRISHSHIAEMDLSLLFWIIGAISKLLIMVSANELIACGYEAGIYMYGKKRMASGKVKLVENAVDLEYFEQNDELRRSFRKRLNIENKFVIGHVGRFTNQKNQIRLIKIFKSILEIESDSILLLVGTGELEADIKREVEILNLEKSILFLGTTKNMKEIYSSIDVFVLPSLYEGFPVVAIEVQAADIPAVFSDTIALTCKITDAVTFLSLDVSDQKWAQTILDVYNNKKINDLKELKNRYDIRGKAQMLDDYYTGAAEKWGRKILKR